MRRSSTKKIFLSIILISLILQMNVWLAASVRADKNQTYYVSPNGDDSNPGTINEPWHTIQHAADMAAPGDTVLIRNGVYNEQIIISHGGNATIGYITFSAYPGEAPIIDGKGVNTGNNGFVIQASYIKITGLEIRNWPDNGICSWNAGYLEISDCRIHDAGGGVSLYDGTHDFSVNRVEVYRTNGGFDASPAEGADCYNGVINNCTVHNCLDPDQAPDGIALGHGGEHNFVFNQCEVYDFFDGFDLSGHDVQVNFCSSHDNWNTGYKIWDDNVTLTNCLGYNNQENNLQLPWKNKPGTVTLRNCDLVGNAELQNIWIQNESHGLRMYNCILACGINVGLDFEHLRADTYQGDYNIFHSNNPDRAVVIRDQNLEFSLDMIANGNWTQLSRQDQHSAVCTNPSSQLFENLAGWNLHLKQGSIAIDAGTPNNAPQLDYDGSSRPQGKGYDIGAFEYGLSPSQTTPTQTPTSTPTSTTEAQKNLSPTLEYVVLPIAVILVGVAVLVFLLKRRQSQL